MASNKTSFRWKISALVASVSIALIGAAADKPSLPPANVTLLRVPHGGIQPQAVVDDKGIIYVIYFVGDPRGGDVFYIRSENGKRFSEPLRVNSRPGTVIAMGNIRGAHLALGKAGRVHVAWMGAGSAEPRGPGNSAPMLYTRLDDS